MVSPQADTGFIINLPFWAPYGLECMKQNLNVPKVNQASYGEQSLRYYGPKIWNSLPFHVKTSENLKTFKDIIKNWNGSTCNGRVCKS